MSADVIRLSSPAAVTGRAFSSPLPDEARAEPLPAPSARPMRFSGDDTGALAPAAVALDGTPLFDTPPQLPSAQFYATSPGLTWHALSETEEQFFARVRRDAAALGIEHVTTWRRREIPPWR